MKSGAATAKNFDQRPTLTGGGRCCLLRERGLIAGVLLGGVCMLCGGGAAPPSEPTAATQPSRGLTLLAPGVSIDWQQYAVLVDSQVVLRHGPLEFFACRPGKEHESILRLNASATHIYMALGLIGLSPGHPPIWSDAKGDYERPTGDLLDIECEWEEDGRWRRVNAFEWLREIEFARQPVPRPWVFAGSLRLADGELAADRSGAAIALVDFPESLVALSGRHSSSNAELWLEANGDRIPPAGTQVRLVLRAARAPRYQVQLDFRGEAFVNGRYVAVAELADLLLLARQLDAGRIQPVYMSGVLRGDQQELVRQLRAAGCPDGAIRIEACASRPAPAVCPTDR
jgi:hypothetical protein